MKKQNNKYISVGYKTIVAILICLPIYLLATNNLSEISVKSKQSSDKNISENNTTIDYSEIIAWADKYHFTEEEIPREAKGLQKLTKLNVSLLKITELPNSIGNLSNLKEINLYNTEIKKLPSSIGKLKNLTRLSVVGGYLTTLPDFIGKLTNLVELSIKDNKIKEIPSSIKNLKKLQILNVSMNLIKKIPNTIGELTALKEFDISINLIKELPKSVIKLTKLKKIMIDGNPIVELPKIFNLEPSSNEELTKIVKKNKIFKDIFKDMLELIYLNNHSYFDVEALPIRLEAFLDKNISHTDKKDESFKNLFFASPYDESLFLGDISFFPYSVFYVDSPHESSYLNPNSLKSFGHYNPYFLDFINAYLLDALKDEEFISKTKPMVKKGFLQELINYRDAYFYLNLSDNIMLTKEYQNCLTEINKRENSENTFSYTSKYLSSNDTETTVGCFFISKKFPTTSYYINFWLRRYADGTDEKIYSMLELFYKNYK